MQTLSVQKFKIILAKSSMCEALRMIHLETQFLFIFEPVKLKKQVTVFQNEIVDSNRITVIEIQNK